MSTPPLALPASAWPWPLDLARYDRRPRLTAAERADLRTRVARRKHAPHLFFAGDLPALAPAHPLARLLQPVLDAWRVAGVDRQEATDGAALLVAEMHRRRSAYWAWSEADWVDLLGLTFRAFHQRHHKAKTCRLFLITFSYLVTGITHVPLLSQCHLQPLAERIFGAAAVAQAVEQVCTQLVAWGYPAGRVTTRFPRALCLVLLARRSPHPHELSTELLEYVRCAGINRKLADQLSALSRGLFTRGHLAHTLEQVLNHTKRERFVDRFEGVPPDWLAWCQRWVATSTYRPKVRQSTFRYLIKAGRWLAATHPDIPGPAAWTREVAADFVAAVVRLCIGDWAAPGTLVGQAARRVGQPVKATTMEKLLSCVRAFFKDGHNWGWFPARFDPYRCLGTPRSVSALIGPDPRVIADDVWAKLLWAGLNLTEDDLPATMFGQRPTFYPLALVRALSTVWLFTGLRANEIRRLRVGCVRWQRAQVPVPWTDDPLPPDAVCWLDVPVNKTSTAFTKAVDRAVGDAVAAWERVRPAQPAQLDDRTQEVVHPLFYFRGHPLGATYLHATLIPLLCRKAGVPRVDARGTITSYRARSTIASQLFNAKEPLTLFELQEWMGHRLVSSTQHYAKLTPAKVAKAYEKAGYFARDVRMMDVLIDQQAVQSGAAAAGEPWKYYDLGHGYCTYDFFDQCAHRMACAKCSFYRPKASSAGQLVEGKQHLQRLLQEIPLLDDERAAVEDGLDAMEALLQRLAAVPAPDGTIPDRSSPPRTDGPPADEFVPLPVVPS